MKIIAKNGISRFIECGLIVLMVVALALLITLPWSITWFTDRTPNDPEGMYIKYLVILTYSGIMSELILWQARGVLHNANCGKAFSDSTVRRLRVLAVECLVLAAFYFATMFWINKFFMAALFVCFIVIGSILLVFAELFRQANQYKEENDMTI